MPLQVCSGGGSCRAVGAATWAGAVVGEAAAAGLQGCGTAGAAGLQGQQQSQ